MSSTKRPAKKVKKAGSKKKITSKTKTAIPAASLPDALIENPELLNQIIECIPTGFALFDPQDRLIAHNKEYRHYTDMTKKELELGPTFEDILHVVVARNKVLYTGHSTKDWIKKRLQLHQNPGPPVEARFKRNRWIQIQDRRTPSGYTITSYKEITELKKREAKLIKSTQVAEIAQKRLEAAIESISEGFVLYDSKSRLVMCNENYRKMTGVASKHIQPGVSRQALMEIVADIRFKGRPKKERNDWIRLRKKHHKSPGSVLEYKYQDGRWIRYQDFRTKDGSRVSLYADITEAKKSELALQDSQRRFQQAIEGMPDGFVIYDENDRLILYNSRYKELTAHAAPYLKIGNTYQTIIRAFAKGTKSHSNAKERNAWVKQRLYEHRHPGAPGEVQFMNGVWIRYSDYKIANGMHVSLLTDITELKARESALKESEAKLEAAHNKLVDAVESMSQTFITFDADEKLVMCNSKYAKIFAKAPEALVPGTPLKDVVRILTEKGFFTDVTEDIDSYVKKRVKLLRKPSVREQQLSDGSWWSLKTTRTQDGGFTFFRDNITEQKMAADALRESEERYALAVRAANEGIWDWNLETNRIYSSHRFEQIIGKNVVKKLKRNTNVIVEKFIYANMHIDDRPRYRENLIRHLKGETPTFECEFRVVEKGKVMRWLRNQGLAQFNSAGRAYRMTGSLDNITERKRAEAALMEAKDAAELASRAKTDFLANISHELRIPLNAIIGFSELMTSEVFGDMGNPKYIDYTKTINDSGQHLLSIINDILDVSQIEVGELDFRTEETPLQPIFDSSLRLVGERASKAGLRLNHRTEENLPSVKTDPRRLKQILINLLTNAVKFTPEGGSVTLKAHMTKTGVLVISIADTGIGIKADDIPKVMTPFVQVDSRLARKYDGTGLGLPLTDALVKMHGAKMKIRSKPRKGTTVSVYFPKETLTP